MKIKIAIFLSLLLPACGASVLLPDQPDGWACSFFFNEADPARSSFLCNRIRKPNIRQEFFINDPAIFGAKAMPLDTYRSYGNYVYDLRDEILECRGE